MLLWLLVNLHVLSLRFLHTRHYPINVNKYYPENETLIQKNTQVDYIMDYIMVRILAVHDARRHTMIDRRVLSWWISVTKVVVGRPYEASLPAAGDASFRRRRLGLGQAVAQARAAPEQNFGLRS